MGLGELPEPGDVRELPDEGHGGGPGGDRLRLVQHGQVVLHTAQLGGQPGGDGEGDVEEDNDDDEDGDGDGDPPDRAAALPGQVHPGVQGPLAHPIQLAKVWKTRCQEPGI